MSPVNFWMGPSEVLIVTAGLIETIALDRKGALRIVEGVVASGMVGKDWPGLCAGLQGPTVARSPRAFDLAGCPSYETMSGPVRARVTREPTDPSICFTASCGVRR